MALSRVAGLSIVVVLVAGVLIGRDSPVTRAQHPDSIAHKPIPTMKPLYKPTPTETPTRTPRPTATPISTRTPTPTATPLPSSLTVTTTVDIGVCPGGPGQPGYSLRCAIEQVDKGNFNRVIQFAIPSSDPGCQAATIRGNAVKVCTISLLAKLPTITASAVTIDGYSQSGATPNTSSTGDNSVVTVRIDASPLTGDALSIAASSHVTVQGLSITNDHSGAAISISVSDTVTVAGSYLGIEPDGTVAGNVSGVTVSNSANVTIGGSTPANRNAIGGNSSNGVYIGFGRNNVVANNLIGTDLDGAHPAGNNVGIYVGGAGDAVIGGNDEAAGNVISGNNGNGIVIQNGGVDVVSHNLIGTDASGTKPLGNGGAGITVSQFAKSASVMQNTIADNGSAGVLVGQGGLGTAVPVAIRHNQMLNNHGLGIDVTPFGKSACLIGASLPSGATPCPVIGVATSKLIKGRACKGCTVEVYVAAREGYALGFAEGMTYLGSVQVKGGVWTLKVPAGQFNPAKQQVTASATTSGKTPSTSEFAFNMPLTLHFKHLQVHSVYTVTRAQKTGRLTKVRVGFELDWQLRDQIGIAGFVVLGGGSILTTRPIALDPSQTYRYTSRWTGSGSTVLGVVLDNGITMKILPSIGAQVVVSHL